MLTLDELRIFLGAFQLRADLDVAPGITAIIGPSGGGKSTLLSALAGFQTLAAGRISWEGRDITTAAPHARPISMLFQDNNLFPHLSISQNVGLGLGPNLRLAGSDKDKVAEAIRAVGLDGMADRKPGALSGGQQSRAALARVLVADRPIVLLDEPFAALGPGLKAEMLDLTREKLSGRTVLMVTHDPGDARQVADQVILLADNVAAPPVDTKEMFANPPDALRAYLGQAG